MKLHLHAKIYSGRGDRSSNEVLGRQCGREDSIISTWCMLQGVMAWVNLQANYRQGQTRGASTCHKMFLITKRESDPVERFRVDKRIQKKRIL